MRLYDYESEFLALFEMAENIEHDENGELIDNSKELTELFDNLVMELPQKLENCQYAIKELLVTNQALKDEAKRLTEKAKVYENRANKIKDMIKNTMVISGESKIKTDKFSFSIKTVQSPNYDEVNMSFLDDEFIKIKKELDKNQIKNYVNAGGEVEGFKYDEKTSLTVR